MVGFFVFLSWFRLYEFDVIIIKQLFKLQYIERSFLIHVSSGVIVLKLFVLANVGRYCTGVTLIWSSFYTAAYIMR